MSPSLARASRVELRVFDEAPTLSGPERERVFERFYRSQKSRSEGIPGSGLGLAIVRWAGMLHGGGARVEPRTTGGNTFVLELPRRLTGASGPGTPPSRAGARPSGGRVGRAGSIAQ